MEIRQIIFTAEEKVELVEDTIDFEVGPEEIAGPTIVTLVSPGTELAGLCGQWPNAEFPAKPGYAAVFLAEKTGSDVKNIRKGDTLFCMGSHASYQKRNVRDTVKIPDGLSPENAVFTRMMGITMSTLTTATARPPEKVLVTGLGLVGHLAAKIFRRCGYEVTGADPVKERRNLLAGTGITLLDSVPENRTFSLVVECSGHEAAVLAGCGAVKKRGEVVLTGVPWERKTGIYAFDILDKVFHNYAVLRSGWEWEVPGHGTDFVTGSLFGNFKGGLDWLAEGTISVEGLAGKEQPEDCGNVYKAMLKREYPNLTAMFAWGHI